MILNITSREYIINNIMWTKYNITAFYYKVYILITAKFKRFYRLRNYKL